MTRIRSIVAVSSAERELIERGRAAFKEMLPDLDFDAQRWPTKGSRLRGSSAAGGVILWRPPEHFSRTAVSLRFSRVVKSLNVLHLLNAGTLANAARAANLLWAALMRRRGGDPEAFSWQGLSAADFEEGEAMLIELGLGKQTTYRMCLQWSALLERLNAAGVCRTINPTFSIGKPECRERQTLLGQQQRMDRMMSDEAIDALARLFAGEFELEASEQLRICLVALLFATGLRFREVATLPMDALRTESNRYFVHYFKAKSRTIVEEKIPLSSSQAELAQEAIERVLKLTRSARRRASKLTASPDAFPVPGTWGRLVTQTELARFVGMTREGARLHFEAAAESLFPRKTVFDVKKVRAIMQNDRSNESVVGVCATASGAWLPLDQALFIEFATHKGKKSNRSRIHVNTIRHGMLLDFCAVTAGRPPSIFERLDLRDRQGKLISFTPHAVRHYVTTKASKAGVADAHLVRWQRREHVGDLQAYKHLTAEDRVAQMKAALRTGRLHGEVAQTLVELAPEDADRYLESVVQAVHVTPLGLCLHDFSTTPCPKALNCVKRCGSFVFDPEDQEQRSTLTKLRERNQRALEQARKAVTAGQSLAEAWVVEFEETIDGIDRLLSGAESPDGTRFERSP